MGIKETAEGLVAQGKAALDADGDGKVEVAEVFGALEARAKETVDAAAVALEEVKKGFDADADGKVSGDEIKAVADVVATKASDAVSGIVEKFTGKPAEEPVAEEPVAESEPAAEEPAE